MAVAYGARPLGIDDEWITGDGSFLECSWCIRTRHLLKTFYAGPGGWTDRQLPDGTVIFTSPTGHAYTTEPDGGMLFPALAQSTGELTIPVLDEPTTNRALMMPTRKQTREQDRRDRIAHERRERTELIAEEERQRQAWLAANYDPPPF